MSADISGIHCVLYALFDAEGKLDHEAMGSQVRRVMASGVSGIVVLGLATEVHKLSIDEQKEVVAGVAVDVGDKVLYGVTVMGDSVADQRAMVAHGLAHGAKWFILQPPRVEGFAPEDYVAFYRAVAKGFEAVFALQNAPQYLGRALGASEIVQLSVASPEFQAIKCETSAVDLAQFVEASGGRLKILNGRGGLEMTDCLRAGADGFVLAPDIIDLSLGVFQLWQQGRHREAEDAYRDILPAMTFMMQSIEHLICYGKRMYGLRTGVQIFDRQPALAPTSFGLLCLENWAKDLGDFGAANPKEISSENGEKL